MASAQPLQLPMRALAREGWRERQHLIEPWNGQSVESELHPNDNRQQIRQRRTTTCWLADGHPTPLALPSLRPRQLAAPGFELQASTLVHSPLLACLVNCRHQPSPTNLLSIPAVACFRPQRWDNQAAHCHPHYPTPGQPRRALRPTSSRLSSPGLHGSLNNTHPSPTLPSTWSHPGLASSLRLPLVLLGQPYDGRRRWARERLSLHARPAGEGQGPRAAVSRALSPALSPTRFLFLFSTIMLGSRWQRGCTCLVCSGPCCFSLVRGRLGRHQRRARKRPARRARGGCECMASSALPIPLS